LAAADVWGGYEELVGVDEDDEDYKDSSGDENAAPTPPVGPEEKYFEQTQNQ